MGSKTGDIPDIKSPKNDMRLFIVFSSSLARRKTSDSSSFIRTSEKCFAPFFSSTCSISTLATAPSTFKNLLRHSTCHSVSGSHHSSHRSALQCAQCGMRTSPALATIDLPQQGQNAFVFLLPSLFMTEIRRPSSPFAVSMTTRQ